MATRNCLELCVLRNCFASARIQRSVGGQINLEGQKYDLVE